MRVTPEAAEQELHLLMHHRVARHAIVKIFFLRLVGQFAIEEQIADFQKVAMFGQLLNRIAAVKQNARVAVNIGNVRLAGRR